MIGIRKVNYYLILIEIGEDKKLADWPEIVEYFWKVAKSSDRVIVEDLDKHSK
jgi:hypothetical protein